MIRKPESTRARKRTKTMAKNRLIRRAASHGVASRVC